MFKLIDGRSFFRSDEEGKATLLFSNDASEDGLLLKQAEALEVTDFMKELTPREGFFYLHINAMGAGEYYGSNRNGDYFPEAMLIEHASTFMTNPAHVFRHHVNKDPLKSIGKVIYSFYNTRMHRIELIAEVDKVKGADEYRRIIAGEYPLTSMACKTPYDRCSICGNEARTLMQYCSHLKDDINKILPDGRKVMALNVAPLSFFDISIVIRPADITSSVLQKVANEHFVGSAYEAEAEGISYDKSALVSMEKQSAIKKASLKKVADLIKRVEDGQVLAMSESKSANSASMEALLDSVSDPDIDLIERIAIFDIQDILNGFAELGMNPSLEFMTSLLLTKFAGIEHAHLGPHAANMLMLQDSFGLPEESSKLIPSVVESPAPVELLKLLISYVQGSSYAPVMVEKRAAVAYTLPASGGPRDGYTNWSIGRSNPELEAVGAVPVQRNDLPQTILNVLFTVAGGALIAKYMISNLAKIKMVNSNQNWLKSSVGQSQLLKSAEMTPRLMELSISYRLSSVRK